MVKFSIMKKPSAEVIGSTTLSVQLDAFFTKQTHLYQSRHVSSPILIAWARKFTDQFLDSRTARADDLKSDDITAARKLAVEFFGPRNYHYVIDCMDGRNMPVVEVSHVPHTQGAYMRTAGGDMASFRQGAKNGQVIVDMQSYKARRIQQLFEEKTAADTIHYSFDSHFGCAAVGGKEQVGGSVAGDGGLAEDIKRKLLLAYGIMNIRNQIEDPPQVYPQFFSYDPHDGTITMGLEIYVSQLDEKGFTVQLVKKLVAEGKVVTTWQFLHDETIEAKLVKVVQPADFRRRFPQSLLSNWHAITTLYVKGKGPIYQKIYTSLIRAYELGGWKVGTAHEIESKQIAATVIENKAKILLKNLITRWSIGQSHHEWQFDKHQEQAIVLTEGGYAPFSEIDVFSIYSQGSFLKHTLLAVSIVRSSRRSGTISDPLRQLSEDDFVKAPVIIVNKAILRDVSAGAWLSFAELNTQAMLQSVDWDNPQVFIWCREDIEKLVRHEFAQHPHIKLPPVDPGYLVDGVYELFDRMRRMMLDPDFRPLILKGRVLVVNLLVDGDRRTHLVLPFCV